MYPDQFVLLSWLYLVLLAIQLYYFTFFATKAQRHQVSPRLYSLRTLLPVIEVCVKLSLSKFFISRDGAKRQRILLR